MGDFLQIRDNFAIPARESNGEGVDFYSLQCQRTKHLVQVAFTCAWGCSFEVGDYVVVGTYYQKWGHGENGYVYLANSQVAYVGANLILACKFFMLLAHHRVKGNEPFYQLSKETFEVIQSILDSA